MHHPYIFYNEPLPNEAYQSISTLSIRDHTSVEIATHELIGTLIFQFMNMVLIFSIRTAK